MVDHVEFQGAPEFIFILFEVAHGQGLQMHVFAVIKLYLPGTVFLLVDPGHLTAVTGVFLVNRVAL